IPRYDCPPYYRPYYTNHTWFSSWDGWNRWHSMWGDHLVRFKSPPPPGYVPPSRYPDRSAWRVGTAPPGFITANVVRGNQNLRPRMVVGRGYENTRPETQRGGVAPTGREGGWVGRRGAAQRAPPRATTAHAVTRACATSGRAIREARPCGPMTTSRAKSV